MNKLKCKKIIVFRNKYEKTTYQKLNEFQKNWISNYCKRNKIDNITKLEIIKNEIKNRRENRVKYINPIILGTLLIVIWENIAKDIYQIRLLY